MGKDIGSDADAVDIVVVDFVLVVGVGGVGVVVVGVVAVVDVEQGARDGLRHEVELCHRNNHSVTPPPAPLCPCTGP